jgi:hypothetical protein
MPEGRPITVALPAFQIDAAACGQAADRVLQ